MSKLKTIFIGTPDFSVPSLRALINDARFEVVASITQPDKKIGRRQTITPTPVKVIAQENNIPVYQPEKISLDDLRISEVDLIVVVAYAQIIPESILNFPKYGCVNVHGSLLPKYRGASCIQATIENGDKETGITIMKMDKGLDTGPIIFQEKYVLEEKDTYGGVYIKLSELGGKILPDTLIRYTEGKLKPIAQDNSLSSYVPMLKKDDGRINWTKDAKVIERFIRSRQPWPSAFTRLLFSEMDSLNFYLKILEVESKVMEVNTYKPGQMFLDINELCVQCGHNALKLRRVQMEAKKVMDAVEFIRGHKDFVGKFLR